MPDCLSVCHRRYVLAPDAQTRERWIEGCQVLLDSSPAAQRTRAAAARGITVEPQPEPAPPLLPDHRVPVATADGVAATEKEAKLAKKAAKLAISRLKSPQHFLHQQQPHEATEAAVISEPVYPWQQHYQEGKRALERRQYAIARTEFDAALTCATEQGELKVLCGQ